MMRTLFFGRSHCEATLKAKAHLERLGFEVVLVLSNGRGERLAEEVQNWSGEYIFCFRSLFVLSKAVLDKAKIAAINFHPGPAEYPGSGCLNFALYDGAQEYGVTAHLMNEKVDNGKILECRRFPILKADTVDSLLERTHIKLLDMFLDLTTGIATLGEEYIQSLLYKSSQERWNGLAKKFSEFAKLQTIPLDVSEEEIKKIIRATYTKNYPPKILLHGYEFVLKSDSKGTAK